MDDLGNAFRHLRTKHRSRRRYRNILCLLLLAAALAFSIWAALNINTLPPEGDAKIYSRMAVNVDDYRVISPDDQPDLSGQFKPSIIRLPGYPVFLASVYSIAGDENYTAVRVVQAVL